MCALICLTVYTVPCSCYGFPSDRISGMTWLDSARACHVVPPPCMPGMHKHRRVHSVSIYIFCSTVDKDDVVHAT